MENSSEVTQRPHRSFVIVWFDLGLLGLNSHGVFLPGNEKTPLHPMEKDTPQIGWMDERCLRPLFCTIKAELGRGQPGLIPQIGKVRLCKQGLAQIM